MIQDGSCIQNKKKRFEEGRGNSISLSLSHYTTDIMSSLNKWTEKHACQNFTPVSQYAWTGTLGEKSLQKLKMYNHWINITSISLPSHELFKSFLRYVWKNWKGEEDGRHAWGSEFRSTYAISLSHSQYVICLENERVKVRIL